MEKEDEFLHTYFTCVSIFCYEKGKEHVEKSKEENKGGSTIWCNFLNILQQLLVAEKSYFELGFLQNKNKSFLRKDNSLRSVYEGIKQDARKLEDVSKLNDSRVQNYCINIFQLINARISVIELYEKIYAIGLNRSLVYHDIWQQIQDVIKKYALEFTAASLTPLKAVFNLEVEILEQLFKALIELQRLQFLPSLALIHGAHTRLTAWENQVQYRETWKLGFLKKDGLPPLVQWLQKLKGAILSKFSLYFHNTLAEQTTPAEMRHLCSKLQSDHYQKMFNFQRKHEAVCVILLSDNQVSCDITDYDSFPIIVAYPPRSPSQFETILKLVQDVSNEFINIDTILYKFLSDNKCTFILSKVEPNIYLVILFESKKSEKDYFIGHFIVELCTNLRCTKVFTSLKNTLK